MKEKIKKLPILGKILQTIYFYIASFCVFVKHKLLHKYISRHRWNKIKKSLLRNFSDADDPELRELIDNIRQQKEIRIFNYPCYELYHEETIPVYYNEKRYPYVEHKTADSTYRKIFFPLEWSEEHIKKSYCQLLVEQDQDSPHCYSNPQYKMEKDSIVLDLGAAEGNFSVEIVDKVKHIYMFEGDSIWWEPLRLTFKEWSSKVTIVPKYVSNIDNAQNISLSTFMREKNFQKEHIFIKMDIEGYEETVLSECCDELQKMIRHNLDVVMAVCCYHRQNSEKELRKIVENVGGGFVCVGTSKGYMILNNFCEEIEFPYFRRGVLFAATKGDLS